MLDMQIVRVIRAWILNVMASWSLFNGDYHAAILRLESLRQLSEKRHGYNHIETVPTLYKLAHAYHHSGIADNFRFSIFLYQRALDIAETSKDERRDALIGDISESMGDWHAQIANHSMADASYQRAIEALARHFGPASVRLLEPLYSRARALRMLGQLEAAQQLETRASWIEQSQRLLQESSNYRNHMHH